MSETFVNDKRVISSSVNLLKYFVLHSETIELTKKICCNAFLQDQVLRAVAK